MGLLAAWEPPKWGAARVKKSMVCLSLGLHVGRAIEARVTRHCGKRRVMVIALVVEIETAPSRGRKSRCVCHNCSDNISRSSACCYRNIETHRGPTSLMGELRRLGSKGLVGWTVSQAEAQLPKIIIPVAPRGRVPIWSYLLSHFLTPPRLDSGAKWWVASPRCSLAV